MPVNSAAQNLSNHSGTFRQEDMNKIALLEKRFGGASSSPPFTPHSNQGGAPTTVAKEGDGATDGKDGKDGKDVVVGDKNRGAETETQEATLGLEHQNVNNSSGGSGHLVSDTPLHSADTKGEDGKKDESNQGLHATAEQQKSGKKRRVSRAPVRVGDKSKDGVGGREKGGKDKVAMVDLTKEQGGNAGRAHKETATTQKSIEKYFTLSNKQASNGSVEEGMTRTSRERGASAERERERERLVRQADALREENASLREELKKTQAVADELEEQVKGGEKGGLQQQQQQQKRQPERISAEKTAFVVELATAHARQARELRMRKLQEDAPRLGTLSVQRKGIDVQEVWENGAAIMKLGESYKDLQRQREQIDVMRKAAKRRLPLPGQPLPPRIDSGEVAARDQSQSQGQNQIHPEDWLLQEEIFKARVAAIKRDEDALKAENGRLEMEKNLHIRELKRLRDEEESRFGDNPVMNKRYLLLELLGKGGFSEVFKALDLTTFTHVAVKIHQLSSQWSESKKASYVKHSVREYHIHKGLCHPRIVSLLDIFEIDNNTFATVLEHCSGGDLEGYVKAHETLPEKEAKSIVAQIISGLLYLNVGQRSQNYIHYDLKPANILFDAVGQCKITDFGLSKVVEDGQSQGMELTSQGAGTYWYLPPECFDVQRTPMISNKVDVWSVGVILYQMVYGKRPFGHEMSQEQILRNDVMRQATSVEFPTKPNTSADCKDFIRQCLAYCQQDRPDVHEISKHKWLAVAATGKKRESGGKVL